MSSDKNELLYQEFEINYNNLSALHRKGTILLRAAKVVLYTFIASPFKTALKMYQWKCT